MSTWVGTNRARRLGRALAVAALLAAPPAVLMPRALFGGWSLSSADALFGGYLPWQADPPPGFQGPQVPQAAEAALRYDAYADFADRHLRQHRLPVWNPWNGFGEPFLGHARVGALNPLDPWRFLLPPARIKAWRVASLLWLAGWATYRLLRRLGLRRSPALLGAVTYALNGFHLAWLHFPHLRCAALLPLLVWMVERLLRRPDSGRAAAAALVVGLVFLADHPETGVLVVLTGGLYGVLRAGLTVRGLGGLARVGRAGVLLATALAVGIGIGWVQIQLTLADGSWPASGRQPFLPALNFLGLFVPGLFGPPAGAWWGPMHPNESAVYFGVFALLAALGALLTRFHVDARVRTFGLVGLVAGALAAGMPGLAELARAAPGLGGTPCNRMTVATALAGSALAALGLDHVLPRPGQAPPARGAFALSAAILLAGVGAGLAAFAVLHRDVAIAATWSDTELPRLAVRAATALGLLAAGYALLGRLRQPGHPRVLRLAPLVLAVLDLGLYGHDMVGEVPERYDRHAPAAVRSLAPDACVAAQGFVLPPNLNLGFGYHDVRGTRSGEVPAAAALLDRFLPSDPTTGVTWAGPSLALERLGVNVWFSARPLGPEGIRLAVGGPRPATARFPLLIRRPVERLTVDTSLAQAWTIPAGTRVATLTVVGRGRHVDVPLRAGLETGDWALRQYAYFARHPRPRPSAAWTVRDGKGDAYPRECYPVTIDLEPPFTPLSLRLTYEADRGWLNLHGVRPAGTGQDFAAVERLAPVERIGRLRRRDVPHAAPDAYLTAGYRVPGAGESVAGLLASPAHEPGQHALLARPPQAWIGLREVGAAGAGPTPCRRVRHGPGRFSVRLPRRETSTVLVIREAYHPDWTARRSSGEPVVIEAVDGAFLGTVLPPGEADTLSFTFAPQALATGLWVCGASLLVWGALVLAARRQRRGDKARPES